VSLDARLKRVSPLLTARERGILVLRSLKDKTPEDPSWRSTMPRNQTAEFNRYIGLMNACNIHLPLYITMVEQHTKKLYLRFMWLDTLIDSGCQVWKLAAPTPGMLARCRKLMNSISISYWDALILAGSLEAGADRLYSEDINPGGKIDGLEIINPFAKP